MLLNNNNDNIDYKENWPAHYYEIADIDMREKLLRDVIAESASIKSMDSSFKNDQKRLEILMKRFSVTKKGDKRIDRFAAAWVNLLIDSRMGINFFNKNRVRKDVTSCLKDLLVIDFESDDILLLEWTNFAEFWIKSCVNDSTYDSTAFGLLRLSDKRLGQKIASEIIDVTYTLPARFGYAENCAPLRDIFKSVFLTMIDHGDVYWSEAISQKNI